MNRSITLVGIFLCMSGVLISCLEELEHVDKISDSSFEPSVDFPLVNSDFTMEQFLTQGKSKARITEQAGLMVLTYDDSLFTPPGDLFFNLPSQQSPVVSITGPEISFPSPGATITITKTLMFSLSTSQGELLDSMLLKNGEIHFQLSSTFPADIELTVDIPAIRQQGLAFQQNFSFTGPGNQTPSSSLVNAAVDLTDNGSASNTLVVSITAQITDTGQPISNTDQLDFSFGMDNLGFRVLFGDLGTRAFPLEADSINVDIFNNAFGGGVTLSSPLVRLSMHNSFGLPIGFDIQSMRAVKPNTTGITLSGPAVSSPANPYLLAAPTYAQLGETVTSNIEIASANSNLPELISSLPSYLVYQFNLGLNPAPSGSKNFVLDTSRLTIGVHLELPFHGQINGLTLSKRFDFNGLGIDDPGQTKLKLKTSNESPLGMAVQVYFVDTDGTVLDSLFTNRSILNGADVDANGFTQQASEVEMEVPLTQEKIDRIEQAEQIVIAAGLLTTNNGMTPVKFSSTDKLRVNLGVNTRVKYNLK
jgi:hypothetical protein